MAHPLANLAVSEVPLDLAEQCMWEDHDELFVSLEEVGFEEEASEPMFGLQGEGCASGISDYVAWWNDGDMTNVY